MLALAMHCRSDQHYHYLFDQTRRARRGLRLAPVLTTSDTESESHCRSYSIDSAAAWAILG